MKKSDVRELRDIVRTLCKELEETPWAIVRMETLMLGLIELARTKKPWVAVDVALTVQEELLELAKAGADARREREQERGPTAGIRTTHPSFTGFVQLTPDAPRPAATVEQMRAAADAAMAADPELVEWDCSVCHKKTLTEDFMPVGWKWARNSKPGEPQYTCVECQMFGPKQDDHIGWFVCAGCGQRTATADGKTPLGWHISTEVDGIRKPLCAPCFATGIKKQYQCMGCDAETESRVFPPPGWKEVEDGEVICFGCAEADAEAGDV